MSRHVMPMVLGIVLLGVAVASRDGWAIPVTIDFSGLPGPDGIPGTLDDVPFTATDFLYSCCGPGEPLEGSARRLDTEYRGVQFCPGTVLWEIGGGFNPDGTPALDNVVIDDQPVITQYPIETGPLGPLVMTFTSPQSSITLDIFCQLDELGTSIPVTLKDGDGNVISSQTLTNADAILGGQDLFVFGRFQLASNPPFSIVELGLTGPSNGGFFIDNVAFDSDQQLVVSGCGGGAPTECGDWMVDPPGEECDDGNTIAGDGCDVTCQIDVLQIGVVATKLVVVDKLVATGKAKVVFVSKDPDIAKGVGTDPVEIEAMLDVAYDAVSGSFAMPLGSNWLVNSASVAKYVNKEAPAAGAVRVGVVKPGVLFKVVAKSLGDVPLDVSGAPAGPVYVAGTVINGGDAMRLCTQFTECVHKPIAGGTGHKLVCGGSSSTGDPACTAAALPTTTSTSVSSTTVPTTTVTSTTVTTTSTTTSSTTSTTICFQDLGDGTILDTCTGLQWEKKTSAVGSGDNAADLHDVDNGYRWAGYCSGMLSKLCQPNLAAEAACKAQTDVAYWTSGCEQCVGAEGTCTVTPITTVWDWLVQVNAANYAGHDDWRLPSESGCNSCFASGSCASCSAHELETILVEPYPCGTGPCIDSIFGPTVQGYYLASSTSASAPTYAWSVHFNFGEVGDVHKLNPLYVRAVRGGS